MGDMGCVLSIGLMFGYVVIVFLEDFGCYFNVSIIVFSGGKVILRLVGRFIYLFLNVLMVLVLFRLLLL